MQCCCTYYGIPICPTFDPLVFEFCLMSFWGEERAAVKEEEESPAVAGECVVLWLLDVIDAVCVGTCSEGLAPFRRACRRWGRGP